MCGKEVQNNNATPICFVMPERERENKNKNWTYECGLKSRGLWRVCL
jgi:NADH:ubiquinone oxidoreductase subunit 3 (subunit A)